MTEKLTAVHKDFTTADRMLDDKVGNSVEVKGSREDYVNRELEHVVSCRVEVVEWENG